MQSKATSVEAYLRELPEDRRTAIQAVRAVINQNIGKEFQEGMQYGMPAWFVPHSVYPDGYHCDPRQPLPFASIASQKNHMAIYMFCIYCLPGEAERFAKAWKATGKKLDMGKGCVRFKKLEDVPLEVVGDAVKRATLKKFIDVYESVVKAGSKRKSSGPSSRKTKAKTSTSSKIASKTMTKKVAKKAASKKSAKR